MNDRVKPRNMSFPGQYRLSAEHMQQCIAFTK